LIASFKLLRKHLAFSAALTGVIACAAVTAASAQTPANEDPAVTITLTTPTTPTAEPTKPAKKPKRSADQKRREDAARFVKSRKRSKAPDQPTPAAAPQAAPVAPSLPSLDFSTVEGFSVPPFLLPIYQAAGAQYGVRWEILAAINEIETNYGRNLSVSTAGAQGWMQFMPGTWEAYGVDANRDGKKDPYNPVDAIFAAARYLKASGAETNIEGALFAYNRANWYVLDVLKRAKALAAIPSPVITALSGLVLGRMPVDSPLKARYVKSKAGFKDGVQLFAAPGAKAVATQDGKVEQIGRSKRLGNFIRLRDDYGNLYTYGLLEKVATVRAVSRQRRTFNSKRPTNPGKIEGLRSQDGKERLYAEPARPSALTDGGSQQIADQAQASKGVPSKNSQLAGVMAKPYTLKASEVQIVPLRKGSEVLAGTVLGEGIKVRGPVKPNGKPGFLWSVVQLEIQPGRGPRINPKPIVNSWKLLAASGVTVGGKKKPGQALLMSKEDLERRVLANPKLSIYPCGRQDIQAGIIDRRVLATMEFLTGKGHSLTITSLNCGHGFYTASGNVSDHSSGNAVDIAVVDGIPITGNQGAGSITDKTVRELLTLQGAMKPSQIITLMQYPGTDNTLALADHYDHIHIGFRSTGAARTTGTNRTLRSLISPDVPTGTWGRLLSRLGTLQNPSVPKSR